MKWMIATGQSNIFAGVNPKIERKQLPFNICLSARRSGDFMCEGDAAGSESG
jgi:hypothetical protein